MLNVLDLEIGVRLPEMLGSSLQPGSTKLIEILLYRHRRLAQRCPVGSRNSVQLFAMPLCQIEDERVRAAYLNAVLRNSAPRKISGIEGNDDLGLRFDRRGQDVPVVRIRQCQAEGCASRILPRPRRVRPRPSSAGSAPVARD